MAITQNDLDISNKSYINKDFDSVYNELLTLAKKISYRYDPTASNESDPFIVLLKLLAFATDKVNYNVDKNILERFMPSATQESSMRDLTSRMGYNMNYYIAAETQVIFKYKYPGTYEGTGFTIPKYSVVTNDVNDVDFVTLKDVQILKSTGVSTDPVNVMQGVLNTLTVIGSDSTNIQLENLDENNRLYFSEQGVAQNGVFISGGAFDSRFGDGWTLVNNLNSEEYGRPCYIFGYDSLKKLPYIEFPEWISGIIGSGIQVDYLVCSGINGNVAAGALSSVSFSTDDIDIGDFAFAASDVTVNNSEAALNGADPETIDEAYQGFKKTIGTFDTLVTCRDYANAIYNAITDSGNDIVSNVQVGDRRNDLNYSCSVVEYTGKGVQTKNEITTTTVDREEEDPDDPTATITVRTTTPNMLAFDLCIYPFNPVKDLSFYSASNSSGYTKSFERLQDINTIEVSIEDNKCVAHNIKSFSNDDILAIKNYYTLEAVISTTAKVNITEQAEILEHIREALALDFNARKLEFGYEIPYDSILKTITNADARIKSVSLSEPIQEPRALLYGSGGNDEETSILGLDDNDNVISNPWFKDVVAKNVLAGRVPLFDYDTDFEYNYGQSTGTHESSVIYPVGIKYCYQGATISAGTRHELTGNDYLKIRYTDESGRVIDKQYGGTDATEAAKIIKPNFTLSATTVGTYNTLSMSQTITVIKVTGPGKFLNVLAITTEANISNIVADSSHELRNNEVIQFIAPSYITKVTYPYGINYRYIGESISADEEHMLQSTESFEVNYVNSSNETINRPYGPGEIIKPNFELSSMEAFGTLDTNEEVAIREVNNERIENNIRCYWQSNKADNSLKWIPDASFNNSGYRYCHIMEENEYFFYTDINYSSLYSYGSGTKLIYTSATALNTPFYWTLDSKVGIDELPNLMLDGISGFVSYFVLKSFDTNNSLTIEEQQILTLTEGDNVAVLSDGSEFEIHNMNNNFTAIDSTVSNYISYTLEGESDGDSLPLTPLGDRKWCARALLDINAGPSRSQTLVNNQEVKLYFANDDDTSTDLEVVTLTSGCTFKFNVLEQLSGGTDIDLAYSSDALTTAYPSIYSYVESSLAEKLTLNDEHFYTVIWPDSSDVGADTPTYTTSLTIPSIGEGGESEDVYIMCFREGAGVAGDLQLKSYRGDDSLIDGLTKFNVSGTPAAFGSSLNIAEGMSIIKIRGSGSVNYPTILKFVTTDATINLTISSPRHVNIEDSTGLDKSKINPLLGLQPTDDILAYMRGTTSGQGVITPGKYSQQFVLFYASNYIDDSRAIELSNIYPLSNAQSFYDYNNIANKWTIPELNFKDSNLRIARSSMK